MRTPILEYFLSDTFGRAEPDPLRAERDPDALLATDLARLAHVLENGNSAQIERFHAHEKINTNGRPAIAPHLAKMLVEWNDRYRELLERHDVFTGLFVNDAPRDQDAGGDPSEFFIVETDNHARIVGTPITALGTIAPHVAHVWKIPNTDNGGLWEDGTQFRSATAHRALDRDHRFRAEVVDPSIINAQDSLRSLKIRFIDTYGNIVCYGGEQATTEHIARLLLALSEQQQRRIRITIGNVTREGEAAHSLEDGRPGTLVAYPNGGNPTRPHIDIARKWSPGDRTSAFELLQRPSEGNADVRIETIRSSASLFSTLTLPATLP
ncbi:MAG: hypothetical protein PHO20_06090 [Candidatus Peribacteraceae bacterium]|nr:hypothetical protein [Candidatus Peribacteraceae bacterium]MDD5740307.1 hypothetical protein [Candidatus Peribacteraceae bacterium]